MSDLLERLTERAERAEAALAERDAVIEAVRAVLADAEAGADAWGACTPEWLRIKSLRAALDGDQAREGGT